MNTKDAAPEFNGTIVLPSGEKLRMIKVEAGSFIMSADDGENEKNETPHPVTLKYDFYLGRTMVTQSQWRSVMGYVPEVRFKGGNLPVSVSWYEAMDFCARLDELNPPPAGYRFTLPTETQWEYAARGGCKSRHFKYSGSDNLDEVATIDDPKHCSYKDYPVAKKKPNELGLHDMSGNGREWCLDDYDLHGDSSKVLPEFSRVLEWSDVSKACRGGAGFVKGCRPGYRSGDRPFRGVYGLAFRIALASTALPEHPQYAEERRRAEEARRNCSSGDFVVELPGKVKLGMVKVEPGTFEMGEGAEDDGKKKRKKPLTVTLTHDYYIGKTTITQEQWRAVMKDDPLLWGSKGTMRWDDLPMHRVNWYKAMAFCARLNELDLAPEGYTFTLPTEAQWEYAARGGCKSRHFKYSGSDDLEEVAWITDDVCPVARKKANELGLYDMSGNVFEWCLDDFVKNLRTVVPEFSRDGKKSAPPRVCRGGCAGIRSEADCRIGARACQDAHRPAGNDYAHMFGKDTPIGFRIVLAAPVKSKPSGNIVLQLSSRENLELVKVTAGSFTMGAQRRGGTRGKDETPHQVTLTKDFYIGRTPVTQAQWTAVMGSNPSHSIFDRGSRGLYPVDCVTWHDAMAFCEKLNERGKAPAGYKFTLPTEAQWEYAARGGSESQGYRYSGSNNFKEVVQCYETLAHWRDSCPVAQKQPNELGLYDMSGNVQEWCLDWYDKDYGCGNADVTDPAGPAECSCLNSLRQPERVLRGGSYMYWAASCRCISRNRCFPGDTTNLIGFRLALVAEPPEGPETQGYKKTGEPCQVDVAESGKRTADRAKSIEFSEDGTVLVKYPAQLWDESYTIPEGVTAIGNNAFAFCENLVRVTLPEGVTSIGRSSFESCKKLKQVDIPGTVTSIGSHAFIGCCRLASVHIPDGVTRIEPSTFQGCGSLAAADIPGSVTSIGESAFQECAHLTSVDIPDGVTGIGKSAFRKCARLVSVHIPAGITNIGESLFQSCEKLIRVNLPAGVTSIGNCAFDSCKKLVSVNIPDTVTSIGESAFRSCACLVELRLPDSVKHIGAWAFTRCERLVRVNIPAGVTCIPLGAFDGCASLVDMYIPDNVTSIGGCVFSGCRSLVSIRLPEGITSIGCCAFAGCSSLASVCLPDSVTSISAGAFKKCGSLAHVSIPDGVKYIGSGAFEKCSSLAHIRIPDGVHVGTNAFEGCKKKP